MNNRIIYKDIAVGAAEAATFSSTNKTDFSSMDLVTYDDVDTEQRDGGVLITDAPYTEIGGNVYLGGGLPYATFERNLWTLDGSYFLRDGNVAFWSKRISRDDGTFQYPPKLVASMTGRHTSAGVSIVFDTFSGDYCNDVNIKWYYNSSLIDSADFTPDGVSFFCEKLVEGFDKIEITFNSTALPHRRVKVEQIIFGVVREFDDDELAGVTIINEFDLLSASLPASTMEFTLYPKDTVQYMFQFKQALEVYHGNGLIGVYYIDEAEQSASNIYSIRANDAVGTLDNEWYAGGAFLSGVSAKTLLETILGDAWTVKYDAGVADTTLYGLITEQSKRNAVAQVLFAWGVCLTTDGSDEIRIFNPSATSTKTLSEDVVYDGTAIKTDAITTVVRVYAHTYTEDAEGDIEVLGVRYKDTKTSHQISNPSATSSTKANSHTVESATLVSTDNLNAVTQRVYDYYTRRKSVSGAFVWSGEKLGDAITFPTIWTTNTANVTMMRLTLSGIVRADFEARGTV